MGYDKSAFGFEDLEVYQASRRFRKQIYAIIKSLPGEEKYALGQQMRRAAISLTNNIAEGYGRYNWQESMQFFRHARASLMEVVDDLSICQDEGYASPELLGKLHDEAKSVQRLLNGYLKYLRRKQQEQQAGS